MTSRATVRSATARSAVGCGALALALFVLAAAAGESAAVPDLGAPTPHPPWDADLGWPSEVVSVVVGGAYALGAGAVLLGLVAVARGARPRPRVVLGAALLAALTLSVVPPLGSADHLSYAAYGRIAVAGDDPYTERPSIWRGGTDPVAGAVQPPWEDTRSVYGPVATAIQAGTSAVGGDSLRLTVWAWQLVVAASFLLAGYALDRLTRHDRAARARAAVLWTLNPVLLGVLVLGAHVDAIAAAAVLGTFALVQRHPLLAGVCLGVAAGTKLPFAVVGLAVCWGLRRLGWRAALSRAAPGLLGAALVLVPAHVWAGDAVYDQLGRASRYVSLATPWRPLVEVLGPYFGHEQVRNLLPLVAPVMMVAVAVALARAVRDLPTAVACPVTADAVRATFVLGTAYLLAAPYVLPWYEVLAWAPLALMGASALDVALLTRLLVLGLAYVPGRVVGMSPEVEQVTLGFRAGVAPWLNLALTGLILFAPRRRWPWSLVLSSSSPGSSSLSPPVRAADRRAPAPARSPR